MNHKTTIICKLNDRLRETFAGGQVYVTSAVADLPEQERFAVMLKVRTHTDFSEDNDPHGEHDFGAFEHAGQKFFWKIDCYDLAMQMASPDPTNPAVTKRVLTIMLASDY